MLLFVPGTSPHRHLLPLLRRRFRSYAGWRESNSHQVDFSACFVRWYRYLLPEPTDEKFMHCLISLALQCKFEDGIILKFVISLIVYAPPWNRLKKCKRRLSSSARKVRTPGRRKNETGKGLAREPHGSSAVSLLQMSHFGVTCYRGGNNFFEKVALSLSMAKF